MEKQYQRKLKSKKCQTSEATSSKTCWVTQLAVGGNILYKSNASPRRSHIYWDPRAKLCWVKNNKNRYRATIIIIIISPQLLQAECWNRNTTIWSNFSLNRHNYYRLKKALRPWQSRAVVKKFKVGPRQNHQKRLLQESHQQYRAIVLLHKLGHHPARRQCQFLKEILRWRW